MGETMTTTRTSRGACPLCGSETSIQTLRGVCKNESGCNTRRVARRIQADKARRAPQCLAPYGKHSVRFCVLGTGHEGLHTTGGAHEWGSGKESPAGALYADAFGRKAPA